MCIVFNKLGIHAVIEHNHEYLNLYICTIFTRISDADIFVLTTDLTNVEIKPF